jgi:hypothetical protein
MGAHVYIGHWTEALHININTHGEEERGSGKGNGNEDFRSTCWLMIEWFNLMTGQRHCSLSLVVTKLLIH